MSFEEQIKQLISAYSISEEGIVKFRHERLIAMQKYFNENGFPQRCSIYQLSLYPVYYREAIYDSIPWHDQNAPLRHLEIDLEVDCMFHNEGKSRKQLSEAEFKIYERFCSDALNYRPGKTKQRFFSILKPKLFGN